jgi:hypothetical protein
MSVLSIDMSDISTLSMLEILVLKYLDDEEIDADHIKYLVDGYYDWTDLEKFYYVPILMLLTKYFISRLYTPDKFSLGATI